MRATERLSNGSESGASNVSAAPYATSSTAPPRAYSASVITDASATSMLSTGRLWFSGTATNDAAATTLAATSAAANLVCGRTEEAFMRLPPGNVCDPVPHRNYTVCPDAGVNTLENFGGALSSGVFPHRHRKHHAPRHTKRPGPLDGDRASRSSWT